MTGVPTRGASHHRIYLVRFRPRSGTPSSAKAQRLAFATPERAGPPYGASPKGVVRGHREAMSPDPSANALLAAFVGATSAIEP